MADENRDMTQPEKTSCALHTRALDANESVPTYRVMRDELFRDAVLHLYPIP
jgi:hypothetical protein